MNRSKIFAFVFAVLMASAMVATPAMAALTYDNETTNTASTSDLVGGETVNNIDSESHHKVIEVISDNSTSSSLANPEEAFTLELTVNDANHEDNGHTFYVNDTATWTVEDSTNGHYSLNVSHAELFAELPRDIDETVTVDVTTTFNESEADEESSTITIDAVNGNERAVVAITDDDLKNETQAETVNESRVVWDDLDFAKLDTESRVDENTTISVVLSNDTVRDKYVDAYDAGSFSSGDFIYTMTMDVEGRPVMIFDSSVGDDRDAGIVGGGFSSSDDTFALWHMNGVENGETATLEVVPQGDDTDEYALEVDSAGNKKLPFRTTVKHFGFDAARTSGIGVAV